MAMIPHPKTGVMINEIETRSGPISQAERDTAQLLLAEGHARWIVAAMLGRLPLAFNGTDAKPADNRRRHTHRTHSSASARTPRQFPRRDLF